MRREFLHTVLHYLGIVLVFIGFFELVPAIYSYFSGENTLFTFLFSSAVNILIGLTLAKNFEAGKLTLGRAMAFSAIAFAVMGLVGAVPYFMHAGEIFSEQTFNAYLSSYFESMSGFTTTGLTMIDNVDNVQKSLLLWRSLTQWIGGIGIIVLFLSVLKGPGMSTNYLYKGEGREDRIEPSIHHTARKMFGVYLFYTAAGFVIFVALGMPLFDSLSHVATVVSTGGFSTNNSSISDYGILIQAAIVAFMMIGATSFVLHSQLLKGNWRGIKNIFTSIETRVLLLVIVIFSIIFAIYLNLQGNPAPIKNSIFQVVSSSTTTGYSTIDMVTLGNWGKLIIIALMFIGGSSGSTAGGLKIIRSILLIRSIPWMIKKYLLPQSAVLEMKISNRVFSEKEFMQVSIYFFMYVVVVLLGTLVIAFTGIPFMNALFDTVSAAGTVGLSSGITQYTMPMLAKVVLIFEMWIGRLEILPVLVWIGAALSSKHWKHFYE